MTWSGTGWTGQPTVVYENGRPWLLVGGYDHGLRRVDATSGTVMWRAELDDVIKGTNTVYYESTRPADDRLVVVTGSRRGVGLDIDDPRIAPLRAFSFATGEELWRLPVPRTENYSRDVDASPLRVDGRLIVAIEPGYVLALDTGTLVPGPGGHPMPSVVASSPLLYTPEDVAAHATDSGSNVVLEGSPALLGDRIYIASSAGHVYGLDRATLAVEWDFACGGDLDSTVVVTQGGKLLVGLERQYVEHGGVFMLDPSKPPAECVEWFFATADRGISEWAGGVVGSVALHPSAPLAAFNSVDGNVYMVKTDALDGTNAGPDGETTYPRPELVFSAATGGSISTPAIVGDRMVVAGLERLRAQPTRWTLSEAAAHVRPGGDGRHVYHFGVGLGLFYRVHKIQERGLPLPGSGPGILLKSVAFLGPALEPVVQGGPHTADVQVSCWARGKPHPHPVCRGSCHVLSGSQGLPPPAIVAAAS